MDNSRRTGSAVRAPACTLVKTALLAATLAAGGLTAGQAQASPIVITTSGTISSGSDPSGLFGGASDLTGDSYTLKVTYDGLGPNYAATANGASDIGDALTGSVTATVDGHSLTTPIAISLGASLSADRFSLFASNLGFDAGGDFVDASQTVTSGAAFIAVPNLQEPFAYTLAGADYGSDTYTFDNAAFTESASFDGTPTAIVYQAPEPASLAVLAAGLFGIGAVRRHRRRRA